VRTAKLLGFYDRGITRVRVDYVGRAALEGSDDTKLAATLRSGSPAPGPAEVRLASARPFVPHVAESSTSVMPMPADRPFELGHSEANTRVAQRQPATRVAVISRQPIAPVEAQPPVATTAVAKSASQSARASAPSPEPKASEPDRWERGFAARFAPAGSLGSVPASSGPVSAFAGPSPSNGAVVSGRGLY